MAPTQVQLYHQKEAQCCNLDYNLSVFITFCWYYRKYSCPKLRKALEMSENLTDRKLN